MQVVAIIMNTHWTRGPVPMVYITAGEWLRQHRWSPLTMFWLGTPVTKSSEFPLNNNNEVLDVKYYGQHGGHGMEKVPVLPGEQSPISN